MNLDDDNFGNGAEPTAKRACGIGKDSEIIVGNLSQLLTSNRSNRRPLSGLSVLISNQNIS